MKALIVIDMQNDFITGSLANKDAEACVPRICELIEKENFDKIIFTRDTHEENYLETYEGKKLPVEHCIANTFGHKVNEQIINAALRKYNSNDIEVINKSTFGFKDWATIKPAFVDISKCDEIILVGTCTDICVVSNAMILKAAYPGTDFKVIANCCAGLTKEKHEAALEVMRSCQIEVI